MHNGNVSGILANQRGEILTGAGRLKWQADRSTPGRHRGPVVSWFIPSLYRPWFIQLKVNSCNILLSIFPRLFFKFYLSLYRMLVLRSLGTETGHHLSHKMLSLWVNHAHCVACECLQGSVVSNPARQVVRGLSWPFLLEFPSFVCRPVDITRRWHALLQLAEKRSRVSHSTPYTIQVLVVRLHMVSVHAQRAHALEIASVRTEVRKSWHTVPTQHSVSCVKNH